MIPRKANYFLVFLIVLTSCVFSTCVFSEKKQSTIAMTPVINTYAFNIVEPILDEYDNDDQLSVLLKICDILGDAEIGISTNKIEPSTFILYDKLNTIKLGFFMTWGLSSEQKTILRAWHAKYMHTNPADVFFAPSSEEIIRTKAAFGCSHYARSFIAIVKALGIIDNPEDLRYVISCKADDYNVACEKDDKKMTINGHQFVMVRMSSKWIALNTSKSEWTAMPENFSPDSLRPPHNIPITFASYPDTTFLLRKIGKDYNDDCDDNSLVSLMNIYRSGDVSDSKCAWNTF